MKYTTINLDREVKKVLKVHCAKQDIMMSNYVAAAINEKMERDLQ